MWGVGFRVCVGAGQGTGRVRRCSVVCVAQETTPSDCRGGGGREGGGTECRACGRVDQCETDVLRL